MCHLHFLICSHCLRPFKFWTYQTVPDMSGECRKCPFTTIRLSQCLTYTVLPTMQIPSSTKPSTWGSPDSMTGDLTLKLEKPYSNLTNEHIKSSALWWQYAILWYCTKDTLIYISCTDHSNSKKPGNPAVVDLCFMGSPGLRVANR